MATRRYLFLAFASTLVAISQGFDLRLKRDMGTPTPEECMKPPMSKFGHECCRLPKERIWGNLRPSLSACVKKMKQGALRPGMPNGGMTPETTPDMLAPTGVSTDAAAPPSTTPQTMFEHPGRRPGGRRPLSERLKEMFTTVYKEIKSTIDSLWQSVVIITDHFQRLGNDSCFMECVFEGEGFLIDKMVNKDALLGRFAITLGQNVQWHRAAASALETCYQKLTESPSTSNTCRSGSEEIFRCVFKQIFFNCPNWTQSDYCIALKDFYQKCPDGPPPEMSDSPSSPPEPPETAEEVTETDPASDTERYTPQPE